MEHIWLYLNNIKNLHKTVYNSYVLLFQRIQCEGIGEWKDKINQISDFWISGKAEYMYMKIWINGR